MRKGEPEFLMDFFDRKFNIHVEYINARQRFIGKLKGTDPEEKRKIIGTEFIRVFKESKRLDPSTTSPRERCIPMRSRALAPTLIPRPVNGLL